MQTDAAHLESYRALFDATLDSFESDYLRWLYCDNPMGDPVGFDAYAGDELAAHYGAVPIAATFEGRPAKGLLSLNTATHPTHQGKGLFTRVAEETYARARELGYEFVVGVSNANSTHGMTHKLKFQLVTPLDVLVGIGSIAAGRDDGVGFELTWSEPALRWRLRRPHARYVATGGDDAIVYAHVHKLGVLAYITHAPRGVAADLPPAKRRHPFRMWIGIDPHLRRRGVLAPLPDRFKPSPLNLIFLDLTGQQRQLCRDTTRFTLLDFDAY
jgi:GNAT superfamily N-acetyltransferase